MKGSSAKGIEQLWKKGPRLATRVGQAGVGILIPADRARGCMGLAVDCCSGDSHEEAVGRRQSHWSLI
eukprot:8210160-Pyramimonas_sp.AAC.1